MKKMVGVAVLMILASSSVLALDFSLKLSVGAAYAAVGDYNDGVDGLDAYLKTHYSGIVSSPSKAGLGADVQLELMVGITRHVAVGLGVGCLRVGSGEGAADYDWTFLGAPYHSSETQEVSVSAWPVTLTAYARLPLAGLRLRLFAGAGYYFGTMAFDRTFQTDFLQIGESVSFTGRKNAFGFHVGAGLDIPLAGRLSLVIDVTGRAVRLTDIQGDFSFSPTIFGIAQPTETGSDYFFWYYEEISGGAAYPMVSVGGTAPSGSRARHGRFDLSGVSVRTGLLFRF